MLYNVSINLLWMRKQYTIHVLSYFYFIFIILNALIIYKIFLSSFHFIFNDLKLNS